MDRSPSPPRRGSPDITGNMLRSHLQNLLEQKSTQLQTLGTMGQEILKQQQELEERIRGFEEDEDEEIGQGTKTKLKELDDAMRAWESQNEDMMKELGGKVCFITGMIADDRSRISCHRFQHLHLYLDVNEMLSIERLTWNSQPKLGKTCWSKSGVSKHY
jgi:hypothetical protein